MELLAAYGDEDDGPIVPLQPKLISKSLELAPYVNPDQSERRLQYVNPHTKELAYNPRVDAMLAPIQGPVDPNARKTLAAEMNTPTGYIEAANLNPTVFNDQFHMFASRKFAHDPAGPAQIDGKPVLIGNVDNASKPDRVEEKERHAFMKQKRKQQGQVDNTTEFLGPWAPYEVKQLPPIKYPGYVEGTEGPQPEGAEAPVSGPEVAPKVARVEKEKGEEEEEEAEGAAAKPAANRFEPAEERRARERDEAKAKSEYARSEREKQLAIQEDIGAKTMLHIPDVRDYLGRTFMSPPSDLKNRPHDCYVPKKVVHTFSGHTKGISVRVPYLMFSLVALCQWRWHSECSFLRAALPSLRSTCGTLESHLSPTDVAFSRSSFSPSLVTFCSRAAWTTKSSYGTSTTTIVAAFAPTLATRKACAPWTLTTMALGFSLARAWLFVAVSRRS